MQRTFNIYLIAAVIIISCVPLLGMQDSQSEETKLPRSIRSLTAFYADYTAKQMTTKQEKTNNPQKKLPALTKKTKATMGGWVEE